MRATCPTLSQVVHQLSRSVYWSYLLGALLVSRNYESGANLKVVPVDIGIQFLQFGEICIVLLRDRLSMLVSKDGLVVESTCDIFTYPVSPLFTWYVVFGASPGT